jgi:6-phosphogluconolactonase (cycloisomerase 2 family)
MRSFVVASCTLAAAALAACSGSPGSPSSSSSTDEAPLRSADLKKVAPSSAPYTLFESLQVRPLALSPDGRLLFAANTPDNRLEIFRVGHDRLDKVASVATGLEPVAVAARSDGEVWVVNHLSDSVSVVDVSDPERPLVVNTLLVGDEPRDIVFAGAKHDRAFITTAHRGQNSPDDPDLFTPGVGRADVWVFDAENLGAAPGGTRLTKLTFFADTPRALAASADGKTVYAAAFFSGDQTTTVSEWAVSQVYTSGMPGPATITLGGQIIPQPPTGLIVKWRLGAPDGKYHWLDSYGTPFDPFVTVSLPDQDVFAIDATKNPPAPVASGAYAHVGTTLFNMAVNPKSGKVYVSNTDAHNDVRFEGHTPGFTSVVGNIVDSRISVITPSTGAVSAVNLNSHLDHATGTGNPALSRAFPQDLTVSSDGKELYVVAQGSSKLAIYDTASIESGTAVPTAANQVVLSGGGPTGVVVNERDHAAYVLTRFDDSISVVDLQKKVEREHVAMYNPEPASVTAGRKFLYSATDTSALGDQACASCHVGGDFDGLAWDLGNPGSIPLSITTAFAQESDVRAIPEAAIVALIGPTAEGIFAYYMPVKGPMTTQSLRGLDNHGPMHWRGDRNGAVQQNGLPFTDGSGNPIVSAQPNSGIFDEVNAFTSFDVAFPGLVGNAAPLSPADMGAFATFALQITYPPNPIRNLDDSLTAAQAVGQAFYFNSLGSIELPVDRFHDCNGCHVLNRAGNAGATAHPGFFGTDGRLSFENESQIFKVPHLRNAYQKIGMYGSSLDEVHAVGSLVPQLNPPVQAVRGFGYQHDGADGTIETFLTAFVFIQTTVPVTFAGIPNIPPNPFGIPFFADPANPLDPSGGLSLTGLELRRALASFVLAFDSNLFPIVGQQITLTQKTAVTGALRLALLEAQATAGQADLVARGRIFGRDAGFLFSNGKFVPDVSSGPSLTTPELIALLAVDGCGAITFTAVPPGEGSRIATDRDEDGFADGDEIALGSDPADPHSIP